MTKPILLAIMGALFTLFTITGGWAFTSVQADVQVLKAELPDVRIRAAASAAEVNNINLRLERMENKLDAIIEYVNRDNRRTDYRAP